MVWGLIFFVITPIFEKSLVLIIFDILYFSCFFKIGGCRNR